MTGPATTVKLIGWGSRCEACGEKAGYGTRYYLACNADLAALGLGPWSTKDGPDPANPTLPICLCGGCRAKRPGMVEA